VLHLKLSPWYYFYVTFRLYTEYDIVNMGVTH
jgi:hypothetical protein